MAREDWTYLNDGLDIATLARGVTSGVPRPPGGGDFLFAFNSLDTTQGAVGLFANQPGFAPMAKGGSIRGAIRRGPSGGPTGFSPFFFISCQGKSVRDRAYLLGLSDEAPHRVVLKKGSVEGGIGRADDPGALLKSSEGFSEETWHHLRLDVIANENGDVILQVFQSDLTLHPLGTPPVWEPVLGMTEFVDDHLGIQSGTPPLTSGRAGFGFQSRDVTRRGYFDHLELYRQV